ncbi:hypothetical protein X975_11131, partial [Stegodyphus mimosarum]
MYEAGLVIFAQIMYKTVILMLPPVQRHIVPLRRNIFLLYYKQTDQNHCCHKKSTCVYKCTTRIFLKL